MGFLGDSLLILLSSFKEERKIKKGKEVNNNLSPTENVLIQTMEKNAENGDFEQYYKLGLMFLQSSSVGYDPERAINYFDKGRKKKNFNCAYAGALYYKGYWSYQHHDDHKCYMWYSDASTCPTNDSQYIAEVRRALNEDFKIYSTKKEGTKIMMIKEVKIV